MHRLALADDLADVVVPVLRRLPHLGLLRLRVVHGKFVDAELDGQGRRRSWQVLLMLLLFVLRLLWMNEFPG